MVIGALTPAQAQTAAEFRSALDSYGSWVRHPRWGEVWVPDDVSPDWRPYTYGHWIYTDEWGWYWVSDKEEEDWGWITYHYGRWAHDRRLGWFWVPGDEWGPAWVDWRRGADYVGWAPLPPDDAIEEYDDAPLYWVFLRPRYMLEPRLHRHFVPRARTTIIIRNTVVINRTIVVEHRRNGRARFAVNAGVSPAIVAAARRNAVPTFRVKPHVLPGTRNVVGAAVIRPQDLKRSRAGQRPLAPSIARTNTAVQPATRVAKPRPLGKNERGRLGAHPPRAAQGAIIAPSAHATGRQASAANRRRRRRRQEPRRRGHHDHRAAAGEAAAAGCAAVTAGQAAAEAAHRRRRRRARSRRSRRRGRKRSARQNGVRHRHPPCVKHRRRRPCVRRRLHPRSGTCRSSSPGFSVGHHSMRRPRRA